MKYYSIVEKNGILPSATTRMNCEGIVTWNKSDKERQILYDFTYMCGT